MESWLQAGADLVSVNPEPELAELRRAYPDVVFRCSERPREPGRTPAPPIDELLHLGKRETGDGVFILANADLRYLGDGETLHELQACASGGAVYAHRCEVARADAAPGLPYLYGYDLFALDGRLIAPEAMAGFRMGEPWWDYLILFDLVCRGAPLSYVASPLISHLTHEAAWDTRAWRAGLTRACEYLRSAADVEGPVAGVLAILCRSLEDGVQPAFAMDGIAERVGIGLGVAMVNLIRASCRHALWFEKETLGAAEPSGRARRVPLWPDTVRNHVN